LPDESVVNMRERMNPEKLRTIGCGDGDLDREATHRGARVLRQNEEFPQCFARAMDRRGHHRVVHCENDQLGTPGFPHHDIAAGRTLPETCRARGAENQRKSFGCTA